MNMKDVQAYELLLRSLDSALNPEEEQLLETALQQSAELREQRESLLAFRAISSKQTLRFKPFFTGRLMSRIQAERVDSIWGIPIRSATFLRVAIPAVAVVCLLLAGVYLTEGALSIEAMTGLSDLSVSDIEENYWVNL